MWQRICSISMTLVIGTTCAAADVPDFQADVLPVFRKYCNGCHNEKDESGGLILEDFDTTLRGGDSGVSIKAGDSKASLLWQIVSGQSKPQMPPKDSPQPQPEELAIIQRWIDAGAKPSAKGREPKGLVTPKIDPIGKVREPITALSADPQGRWLAIARPNAVEIVTLSDRTLVKTLTGHTGSIADVQFSKAGDVLVVAAGESGLSGEATVWRTSDWNRARTIVGHRDSLYAVALSPDGQRLATASYDRDARVWDVATGKEVALVTGHNDAIYSIAFHPSGKWLATASGDRTVKLWDVATGQRLDTFSQPAKEQYSVNLSPDGKYVAAGGVDNRVRIWELSADAREGTNEIRYARLAHEAPILRVLFSPDGKLLVSCSEERRIKVWETRTFTQVALLERQTDWPSAVAFAPDSRRLFVGRMDGSLSDYAIDPRWAETKTSLSPLPEVPAVTRQAVTVAPVDVAEVEPNDALPQAQVLTLPANVRGEFRRAGGQTDDDLYWFSAKAGETWILETNAARSQSLADTKLEILHLDGSPVRRALLQAVRDSWINFRPIDSSQLQVRVEFWEEMDLNQFLYMNGEIGKFYRAPRGPDSGYDFYENRGKRRTYFETTPITHAKDELVYIVEAFPPDANLIDNGLPVFPLNFVNDDDAERELGSDSRLTFTAPETGEFLVRVSDARGFSGEKFAYQLSIRAPHPDFRVTLDTKNAKVPAGSGQRLKFSVDRIDHFDGPIQIDVANVPPGFTVSTPTTIQPGHLETFCVLTASADAEAPTEEQWNGVQITATAQIGEEQVTQNVGNLGKVVLEKPPTIRAVLIPDSPASTSADGGLVLAPGTTITALIRVERNGFDGDVKFDVDNLPHGVIVDNIGLSGVLVRKGEFERQIFLTARPWVPNTTRAIHAVAQGQGNVATSAILLHVRSQTEVADRNR